jgi:hypothetical protein
MKGGGGSKGGGRVVGEVWSFQGGACRYSRGVYQMLGGYGACKFSRGCRADFPIF